MVNKKVSSLLVGCYFLLNFEVYGDQGQDISFQNYLNSLKGEGTSKKEVEDKKKGDSQNIDNGKKSEGNGGAVKMAVGVSLLTTAVAGKIMLDRNISSTNKERRREREKRERENRREKSFREEEIG